MTMTRGDVSWTLLVVVAALGGCASSDDAAAVMVSGPSGGGGAGGSVSPFDPDAAGADVDAQPPYAIDGTGLGCTCATTTSFTQLATGQQGPVTLDGVVVRLADGGADAAADFPFTVVSSAAVGGLGAIALTDPTKSLVVIPPPGHACVVVDYVPQTAAVPTMRLVYGGTQQAVAGPAGGPVQIVLTPTPEFVNSVVLRVTPAIDSVSITPAASGGIELPAICFGTDAPKP
jgi:hypothetical protein